MCPKMSVIMRFQCTFVIVDIIVNEKFETYHMCVTLVHIKELSTNKMGVYPFLLDGGRGHEIQNNRVTHCLVKVYLLSGYHEKLLEFKMQILWEHCWRIFDLWLDIVIIAIYVDLIDELWTRCRFFEFSCFNKRVNKICCLYILYNIVLPMFQFGFVLIELWWLPARGAPCTCPGTLLPGMTKCPPSVYTAKLS